MSDQSIGGEYDNLAKGSHNYWLNSFQKIDKNNSRETPEIGFRFVIEMGAKIERSKSIIVKRLISKNLQTYLSYQ